MFGQFTVLGGDFKKGTDHQFLADKFIMKTDGKVWREQICIQDVESIERVTEENVKRVGGSLGWGIAGAVALGPIGFLAGILLGGKGTDVVFACSFKDGRKFLATTPVKVFNQIQVASLLGTTGGGLIKPESYTPTKKLPSGVVLCQHCGLKNKEADINCRYCKKLIGTQN